MPTVRSSPPVTTATPPRPPETHVRWVDAADQDTIHNIAFYRPGAGEVSDGKGASMVLDANDYAFQVLAARPGEEDGVPVTNFAGYADAASGFGQQLAGIEAAARAVTELAAPSNDHPVDPGQIRIGQRGGDVRYAWTTWTLDEAPAQVREVQSQAAALAALVSGRTEPALITE